MTKGAGLRGLWGNGLALLLLTLVPACGRLQSGERATGQGGEESGDTGTSPGNSSGAASSLPGEHPDGQQPRLVPLVERSFAVTASVELVEPESEPELPAGCANFDFTARFAHDADAGWLLIGAVSGEQNGTALEGSGSHYRAVIRATPPKLDFDGEPAVFELPMGECCEWLLMSDLTLTPEADPADGRLVGFSAVGAGESDDSGCGGDTILKTAVRVRLSARPDRVAPRMTFPAHRLHPFDAIELRFSEVVSGDIQASLLDTAEVALPLQRRGFLAAGGPFWGFRTGPLLSFGRVANLELEGNDLAGNPFTANGQVASVEDPGILAADGFEGDVPALAGSQPRIVSQGAISGAHSLQVGGERGSRGRITFHLRSAAPAKFVRFQAQNLDWVGGDDEDSYEEVFSVQVEAAALGGDRSVSSVVPPDQRGSGSEAPFPAPQPVELELPQATTDAIVSFDLEPRAEDCGLVHCRDIPALIDDLRLE